MRGKKARAIRKQHGIKHVRLASPVKFFDTYGEFIGYRQVGPVMRPLRPRHPAFDHER